MSTKFLSACATTALALAATFAMIPPPDAARTTVQAEKGDLACHRPCGTGDRGSLTTSRQIGAATTVLVRWTETTVASR